VVGKSCWQWSLAALSRQLPRARWSALFATPATLLRQRVDGLRFLLRDRDAKFTAGFDAVFTAAGMDIGPHLPQSAHTLFWSPTWVGDEVWSAGG